MKFYFPIFSLYWYISYNVVIFPLRVYLLTFSVFNDKNMHKNKGNLILIKDGFTWLITLKSNPILRSWKYLPIFQNRGHLISLNYSQSHQMVLGRFANIPTSKMLTSSITSDSSGCATWISVFSNGSLYDPNIYLELETTDLLLPPTFQKTIIWKKYQKNQCRYIVFETVYY